MAPRSIEGRWARHTVVPPRAARFDPLVDLRASASCVLDHGGGAQPRQRPSPRHARNPIASALMASGLPAVTGTALVAAEVDVDVAAVSRGLRVRHISAGADQCHVGATNGHCENVHRLAVRQQLYRLERELVK